MSALVWEERPELNQPVVIAAFAGWNDAGEAATGTIRYLIERWAGVSFAHIDAEDFFDFTETRPQVSLENGLTRRIDWPLNVFFAGRIPELGRDVILLEGTEPQLKWKTFSAAVTEVAQAYDAAMVICLGALLADVPHTRPAPCIASSSDAALIEKMGLLPARYEGPTGITGVLADACAKTGIPTLSIWASVPHYISTTPSPKGILALARKTAELLDAPLDTEELQVATVLYQEQVTEVVNEDEDMVEYVSQLEAAAGETDDSGEQLAREAERFLREQP